MNILSCRVPALEYLSGLLVWPNVPCDPNWAFRYFDNFGFFLKILDSLKLLDTLKIWNIVDFLGNFYVLVKTHAMRNMGLICLDG